MVVLVERVSHIQNGGKIFKFKIECGVSMLIDSQEN